MADKRPQNNEVTELENAFHNLAEKNAAKKVAHQAKLVQKRKSTIIITCAILAFLVIAFLLGGFLLNLYLHNSAVIHSKLTIAGVDVSGMTRAEAEAAVSKAASAYADSTMAVTLGDHVVRIPYALSGISLDVEAAVDAAVAYEQVGSELQALDISSFMTINKDTVQAQLAPLSEYFNSTMTQSTYEVIGEAPVEVIAPDETMTLQVLRITKGTPGIALNQDDLYQHVLDAYSDRTFDVVYTPSYTEPDPIDLEALYSQIALLPVEAEMDPETFEISGGYYGYDFDIDSVRTLLEQTEYGQSFEVSLQWVAPENTAEELSAVLFRDVLSTYTTKAGSIWGRDVNLRLACQAINGMILYPGDVFSYNQALGERTIEKGYQYGTSYINGESVPDIGGGICQVSSTLFYCTVVADLQIVERTNHPYASSYTPLSTDATVFWGGLDFKFKNNTDYPIRIEASSNAGTVTVSLIGTDTKPYYVKFVSERLQVIPYEEEYREYEPDNEKGYKDGDIVSTPYTGYASKGYRVKYDKETNEKISSTLECSDYYYPRNRIIAKIVSSETDPSDPVNPTDPVDPTEPETPTDPPTTDAPTTEAPDTDPPTTAAPPTEPPATEPPATEPPATEAPTDPPSE